MADHHRPAPSAPAASDRAERTGGDAPNAPHVAGPPAAADARSTSNAAAPPEFDVRGDEPVEDEDGR